MAIDVIAKWVIVLIVIAVVTELFLSFTNKVDNPFEDYFGEEKVLDFPKIIEQKEFSSGQISTYIESCYSAMTGLPDNEQKNINCYVLTADNTFNSSVTESNILNDLNSEIRDKVEIDTEFKKELIIIKFEDIGDKIVISD